MASTQGVIGGSGTITIDGEVWNGDDIKISPHGYKRETINAQTGIAGYTETATAGYITAKIYDRRDRLISAMMEKRLAIIIIRMNTGKVITGNGMWLVEQPELNTKEGSFDIRFEGPDVVEDIP